MDRFFGRHPILARLALLVAALAACGLALEIGFRVLDPYPYIAPSEVNRSEHGNLSQYDPVLGWKGVPAARELFVTRNARVTLEHNRQGFRDIEAAERDPHAPAIVLLGDSFTWGYEVAFEDMFANLLRQRLTGFELYNLAQRGYGTDQSLLTFRDWHSERCLALVILVFCENDIWENNSLVQYRKPKPRFAIIGGELQLRNVPVPRTEAWDADQDAPAPGPAPGPFSFLYRSHLVHDLSFRLRTLTRPTHPHRRAPDLTVTGRLLETLRDEVRERGGQFRVVAIPSKSEIQGQTREPPYQPSIATICDRLGVPFLDLAPALRASLLRTYFRDGMHWTPRGHRVAAEALWRGIDWPDPESCRPSDVAH
jgi:lysophospholipase L1-like esterase